ncbi:MAG: DUF2490 domain-containing protein [Arcicella sp.]|nr:DUF2490 domain-containing protein [Arcicella sp.]
MKGIFIVFLLVFMTNGSSFAQHYEHFTSWNRLAVNKKLSEHWEMNAEIHWRRQSDFTTPSPNPLALRLTEGYRVSTVYRVKEMAFNFAPIVFHSHPLYANNIDLTRPTRWEIRPILFVEWTKVLSPKWTLRSRLGYEYRLFQQSDGSWGEEQGRTRLRFQMRFNINTNNIVYVSEEPLVNIVPNVPANVFSQNQLYFAYNHTFSPHFSTEIGYMRNHRQRVTLEAVLKYLTTNSDCLILTIETIFLHKIRCIFLKKI